MVVLSIALTGLTALACVMVLFRRAPEAAPEPVPVSVPLPQPTPPAPPLEVRALARRAAAMAERGETCGVSRTLRVVAALDAPCATDDRRMALSDVIVRAAGYVDGADPSRLVLRGEQASVLEGLGEELCLLVAELLDNALAVAGGRPPTIRGSQTAGGYVLRITDSGPGMGDTARVAANRVLAGDRAIRGASGHLVVAFLAGRHGLEVTLEPATSRGTAAVVLIPSDAVVPDAPPEAAVVATRPVGAANGDRTAWWERPAAPARPRAPGPRAPAPPAELQGGASHHLAAPAEAPHVARADGPRPTRFLGRRPNDEQTLTSPVR